MAVQIVISGRIHSPHFIFIRCDGAYTDAELLQKLELVGYERIKSPPDLRPYVCITNDRQWTHIADDWSYTLWHMPSTRDVIEEFGKDHEVFACSVGECDRSWEFVYYRNGRLLRKYIVEDPHFRGGVVVEDHGVPLEGEEEARKLTDEQETVLAIASSLGIDVRHNERAIRVYARPLPHSE